MASSLDNHGGLMIGVCSEQGKRPYQEDEYAVYIFTFIYMYVYITYIYL